MSLVGLEGVEGQEQEGEDKQDVVLEEGPGIGFPDGHELLNTLQLLSGHAQLLVISAGTLAMVGEPKRDNGGSAMLDTWQILLSVNALHHICVSRQQAKDIEDKSSGVAVIELLDGLVEDKVIQICKLR